MLALNLEDKSMFLSKALPFYVYIWSYMSFDTIEMCPVISVQ